MAGIVNLRHQGSGELRCIEVETLRRDIVAGHVAVVGGQRSRFEIGDEEPEDLARILSEVPVGLMSEASQRVFIDKHTWLNALRRSGLDQLRNDDYSRLFLKDLERRLGEECPYTIATLYKASLKLRNEGDDPRALLPRFHLRGGPGRSRLHPLVSATIEDVIEAAAAERNEIITVESIWRDVLSAIQRINFERGPDVEPLAPPSRESVARRLHARVSAYDLCVRRYGRKYADQKFREMGARVRAERPLEVVEYDDMDTACFLVDEVTGLPWGRAYTTAGVDQCLGAPMAVEIGDEPRSRWSLASAIKMSIFPKDMTLPEFSSCVGSWECYGLPGVAILDNASYNDCYSIISQFAAVGVEVCLAKSFHPTGKCSIEHLNGVVKSQYISKLPGWCGRAATREKFAAGLSSAVLTLGEFRRGLYKWIVDEYMRIPRTDGRAIVDRWRAAFRQSSPLLPHFQPDDLVFCTLPHRVGLRSSGGVLHLNLRYQSEALAALRRKIGWRAMVDIRVNPMDLKTIYVFDPLSRHYLRVPCIDCEGYANRITESQQRLIIKQCKRNRIFHPSFGQMVQAREQIVDEAGRLAKSKKVQQRKQSYRARDMDVNESSELHEAEAVHEETYLEGWCRELSEEEIPTEVVEELGMNDPDDLR